jgi:CRISPR-associated protein Cas1
MSQRWRVIDLTEYSNEIETAPGHLIIQGQEIALSDVTCILTGGKTRWTGSMVHMVGKYEIPILSCDWRGIPIAVTTPWSTNSRIAARHHAQISLSLPRQKNAWMQVIRAKIQGQAANLDGAHASRLSALASSVRSGDPENLEAQAARMYWSRVFNDEHFSRDAKGQGRNLHLNYGYTVLRGSVIRAICAAGLLPSLGIFHHGRANAFGLADDLIEPFRPAVDYYVGALPASSDLKDPAVKKHLVSVVGNPMGISGASVGSSIDELAQRFAMYCEGEIDRLPVPQWVPPDG